MVQIFPELVSDSWIAVQSISIAFRSSFPPGVLGKRVVADYPQYGMDFLLSKLHVFP